MTAVLFLLALACLFLYTLADLPSIQENILTAYQEEHGEAPGPGQLAAAVNDHTEAALNTSLDRSHLFIQLFGGIQRALGKHLVADSQEAYNIAKLSDGYLNFVYLDSSPVDTTANAQTALDFARQLGDIPLLFVQAPQKIAPEDSGLPTGVYDYGNQEADQFLGLLAEGGVDCLDLRETFTAQENYHDYFFRTDHHWRPEGAFLGFQTLYTVLTEDYGLDIDPRLTDLDQYSITTLEDFFLGSQGKRVGTLYAGTDDFSLIVPKFETSFTLSVPDWGIWREGSIEDTLYFQDRVAEQDYFGGNPYTFYGGGDYPLTQIINRNNPDGPTLLLIRDSFACALTPFLANACGELDLIDLRYFQGNVADYAAQLNPDLVLFLYAASSDRLESMFCFDSAQP